MLLCIITILFHSSFSAGLKKKLNVQRSGENPSCGEIRAFFFFFVNCSEIYRLSYPFKNVIPAALQINPEIHCVGDHTSVSFLVKYIVTCYLSMLSTESLYNTLKSIA